LDYDESKGPKQYEIGAGDDFHSDSKRRSRAQWQFPTFPHLIFSPADNLGKFGWEQFRASKARAAKISAEPLSWPLHAIGDATVPMHVVNTSGWGHRPFEQAVRDSWSRLLFFSDDPTQKDVARALQVEQAARILAKAYQWRTFILNWRAAHPGQQDNVPVRELVTALAQETYSYAAISRPGGWPFDSAASLLYLADEESATLFYKTKASIDYTRPLIENGAAASLAFLMSAMER
jgi:hypothetical protein